MTHQYLPSRLLIGLGLIGAASTLAPAVADYMANATSTGELILNFRNADNTKNLGVDIGAFSSYDTDGPSFTVPGINATELTTFFGGNLDNVFFSVAGSQNSVMYTLPNQTTLYVSQPKLGVAYDMKKDSTQNLAQNKITSVVAGYTTAGEFLPGSTTAKSIDPILGNSYSKQVLNSTQNPNWGDKFQGNVEGATGPGFNGEVSIELHSLPPWDPAQSYPAPDSSLDDSRLVGRLTVTSAGAVTYAAAVPEPGTLALSAVAGAFFLVAALRRRKSA